MFKENLEEFSIFFLIIFQSNNFKAQHEKAPISVEKLIQTIFS